MKPCSKYRKPLAWLALGELDAHRAANLQAHLATCDACRRYLEEVTAVEERLSAAEISTGVQASESFHRKAMARLRTEQPGMRWEILAALLASARRNSRLALPVSTAALVLVALALLRRQPEDHQPLRISMQTVVRPGPKSELLPTVSNYQRAANRSPDELDELLTAQARRPRSQTTIYTASIFAANNLAD